MAQIAAALAFACFFIAGAWIISVTSSRTGTEGPLPACIGLCLMGTAFYLGPKLWLAADARTSSVPDGGAFFSRWSPIIFRYLGVGLAVLAAAVVGIVILRIMVRQ